MKQLITILLLLLNSFIVLAQEKPNIGSKKITGVITDSEGMPIPGVNVKIEGSKENVQTDFDGNYSLNVKEGEKLVVSFIGMIDETITVNKQNAIDFKLRDDENIVWNGNCYGPYTKNTKSVTALWDENKEFTEMLKNGVSTSPIPETKPYVIRCIGSINGSPEPLYIIDGVLSNVDTFKQLNPNTIVSISVLKDEMNTFMCKNTNGVVVIKTKNGLTRKEKRKLRREVKNQEKKKTN